MKKDFLYLGTSYTHEVKADNSFHFSPKSYKNENYRYTLNKDENPFYELTKSVMKVDYTK